MIDRAHALPIKRQAHLVGISRGTAYYRPEPVSQKDLALMRSLDDGASFQALTSPAGRTLFAVTSTRKGGFVCAGGQCGQRYRHRVPG